MKHQSHLLGLLCAVLIQPVAFAKQPVIQSASPVVVLMPFLSDNPDFFELTPVQKQQVANVALITNQKREPLDQSILDLRAELREELLKFKPDISLVQQLSQDLLKGEQQRLDLSIECSNGLRKILTEEQWKTLLELSLQ